MTTALRAPASSALDSAPSPRRAETAPRAGIRASTGRSPAFVLVPFVAIMVFATLLTAAYIQSMLVTGQKQLDGLDRELTREIHLVQNERARHASETSPGTVVRKAEALGMTDAGERIVLGPEIESEPPSNAISP